LGVQNDPDYFKNFTRSAELVILSIKVTKSNSFWGSTDVCLIITKENIYHFEKKRLKNHRLVEKMLGFTKSSIKGCNEFVIHFSKKPDLLFKSD